MIAERNAGFGYIDFDQPDWADTVCDEQCAMHIEKFRLLIRELPSIGADTREEAAKEILDLIAQIRCDLQPLSTHTALLREMGVQFFAASKFPELDYKTCIKAARNLFRTSLELQKYPCLREAIGAQ